MYSLTGVECNGDLMRGDFIITRILNQTLVAFE